MATERTEICRECGGKAYVIWRVGHQPWSPNPEYLCALCRPPLLKRQALEE